MTHRVLTLYGQNRPKPWATRCGSESELWHASLQPGAGIQCMSDALCLVCSKPRAQYVPQGRREEGDELLSDHTRNFPPLSLSRLVQSCLPACASPHVMWVFETSIKLRLVKRPGSSCCMTDCVSRRSHRTLQLLHSACRALGGRFNSVAQTAPSKIFSSPLPDRYYLINIS